MPSGLVLVKLFVAFTSGAGATKYSGVGSVGVVVVSVVCIGSIVVSEAVVCVGSVVSVVETVVLSVVELSAGFPQEINNL